MASKYTILYAIITFAQYCIIQCSSQTIEAYHIGVNLDKNVSSANILDRYPDGHCMYPGVCNLPINKCNIPRIPLSELPYDSFIEDYVTKQRPVIIQLCKDSLNCDLSEFIDNSSNIWEWHKMISSVRPNDYLETYLPLEQSGSPKLRSKTCDIHALDDRNKSTYKPIIDSIKKVPKMFEKLDFFNDLVGYLSYSDGPLLGNKWIVFGNTGSGAAFHFDYYLTSFWNMVVEGSKFWILIPPHITEQHLFQNENDLHRVITMENWQFFVQIYPFMNDILKSQNIENYDNEQPFVYECMQRKGEIMYAPSKWYHATINLNASLSISRNMMTQFNYVKVFEFITSLQSMHSIDTKTKKVIGVKHAVNLCAALYHFDAAMWKKTMCATKLFLQRLNSFELLFDDRSDNVWNGYYRKGRPNMTNAKIYINACNYAARHALFSSFR